MISDNLIVIKTQWYLMVNCDMSEVRTSSEAKCRDNRFGNGGNRKC